jgi:hypothetical protein
MLKRRKFQYFALLTVLFLSQTLSSYGQETVFDVGMRFQRTVNLYWENGVSVQYSNKNLMPDRLYFGFSYMSSRLGTAINSNAIKQDSFLFNTSWYFKPQHALRPIARFNLGYFMADYEEPMFDVLENTSFLLSPEIGAVFETKSPLKVMVTMGYNLITGDGTKGAGTVYPLFAQSTLSWTLIKK